MNWKVSDVPNQAQIIIIKATATQKRKEKPIELN